MKLLSFIFVIEILNTVLCFVCNCKCQQHFKFVIKYVISYTTYIHFETTLHKREYNICKQ